MNLNFFAEIIEVYLPAFIGAVAQIFFLLLPVDFKNWIDDDLNVMTYVALQMLVAAAIFVGIPFCFELYDLSTRTAVYILLVVGVLGWVRAVRIIPLEATHLEPVIIKKKPGIVFNEFYENQRMFLLGEISQNAIDGQARYKNIKERLALRKPEKVDQLGGGS